MTDSKRSTEAKTPPAKKAQKAEAAKRRGRLHPADVDWVVNPVLKRGFAQPRVVEQAPDARSTGEGG